MKLRGSLRAIVSIAAFTLPACLSMQSQTALDELQEAFGMQPYVEAFIEYPGPKQKWAGPTGFVFHVVAKDAGLAQITVMPALFDDVLKGPQVANRVPGSVQGVSGERARERLNKLAKALQGAEEAFSGCMYPVRVRLMRADGAIMEKVGCRSASGWSRLASETVDYFISAALYGV